MIFLDTNILVSHIVKAHPFHDRSARLIGEIVEAGDVIAVSPQVIGEAYVTVTSPRKVASPLAPDTFRSTIRTFCNDPAVTMIYPRQLAVNIALESAVGHDVRSPRFFDYLIYGTMLEHGVTKIATFNEKDFRNLDGIELVEIP